MQNYKKEATQAGLEPATFATGKQRAAIAPLGQWNLEKNVPCCALSTNNLYSVRGILLSHPQRITMVHHQSNNFQLSQRPLAMHKPLMDIDEWNL